MTSPTQNRTERCGCCEGIGACTPEQIANRPGLSAVAYRIGTHARFKESLLARLASEDLPALQALRTRDDDDFFIALLDGWATVADVLTFYQERIVNESYLRTATEVRSLYHLAGLIGYRPHPGVAASTWLAFSMQSGDGAPAQAVVAAGTRVQSIPGQGEKPQVFETIASITARPQWNALRPQTTRPQTLSTEMDQAVFKGLSTNLKTGDGVLIVTDAQAPTWAFKQVLKVTTDAAQETTSAEFAEDPVSPAPFVLPMFTVGRFLLRPTPLTGSLVTSHIRQATWPLSNLKAQAKIQRWSLAGLKKNLKRQRIEVSLPKKTGIFSLARQAAVFGHNAPKWKSLPVGQRYGEIVKDINDDDVDVTALYPDDWDSPARTLEQESDNQRHVYLDAVYKGIAPGSWVVLATPSLRRLYQVEDTAEVSRSGFSMSAKVTRLTLTSSTQLGQFHMRDTTVHLAAAEPLALAPLPVTGDVPDGDEKNSLVLEEPDLELERGRTVILTGERSDLEGVTASEVLTIDTVVMIDGYTRLTFVQALEHPYKRGTVTINANTAPATHGEHTREAIGSGDGTVPFQRFQLRRPPLTQIAATTPSGSRSTLQIRVDDLRWQEVASLYGHGPDEQVYVVRTDTEGETTVQFGDGVTGARLPTGQENVQAEYRRGMGREGLVAADQLSLLLTKPLGVRSVTNPLAASGAQDREGLDDVRNNAPLAIMTLDRLVALQDYEDFARAFAGIAKALATWTWDGRRRGVFITVAGPDGAAIDPSGATFGNLTAALQQAGDPLVAIVVESYRPAFFQVEAGIMVNNAYDPAAVLADVTAALQTNFGFQARAFGQPIRRSEVVAVMQQVAGVTALDLDALFRTDSEIPETGAILTADVPQAGVQAPLAAELLTLDPRPVALKVI
jgi:hypothetical protein